MKELLVVCPVCGQTMKKSQQFSHSCPKPQEIPITPAKPAL